MNRRGRMSSLLALTLVVCACEKQETSNDPRPIVRERPLEAIRGLADRDDLNLLFVVVDTLRADRLKLPRHISKPSLCGGRRPSSSSTRCSSTTSGRSATGCPDPVASVVWV